jgi:hypothetical protein
VPKRPSSAAADEGTAAHEAAALALQEGKELIELVGRNFHGVEITEEHIEYLQVYIDYVRNTLKMKGANAQLYVEKKFDLSWLRHDMWGTNDAAIAVKDEELIVIDLKFGAGVVVEVEENSQLMYYGLGALKELNGNFETVRLVIIQPRARHARGPIREWVLDASTLMNWAKELGQAADETRNPQAPLSPGDWCRFCDASGVCPSLRDLAYENAKIVFDPLDEDAEPISTIEPSNLVADDLERALRAVPVVEQWCRSVETAALGWLQKGEGLPGFKLVRKKTNRAWIDEDAVKTKLQELKIPPKEYYTEPKLKGPAQIEKIKAVGKKVVAEMVFKPEGGLTVAPDCDPRPEAPPPVLTTFENLDEDNSHLE